VFSASVIAHLEAMRLSDTQRNAMWQVVPHPEWVADFVPGMLGSLENILGAQRHMPLWLRRCRLNAVAHTALPRYLLAAFTLWRGLPRARIAMAAMR